MDTGNCLELGLSCDITVSIEDILFPGISAVGVLAGWEPLPSNLRKTINSNSKRIISIIKQNMKKPMTGGKFANNDQIIDLAIESFLERLKEQCLV